MKGVVVFTDDMRLNTNHQPIEVQDFDEPLYRSLGEVVGGYIEIVHPVGLPDPYIMIVNDAGLLLDLDLNPLASILYDTPHHHHPIVGNVVIMKEGFVGGEPDIVGLEPEDINAVNNYMLKLCGVLRNLITVEFGEDDK